MRDSRRHKQNMVFQQLDTNIKSAPFDGCIFYAHHMYISLDIYAHSVYNLIVRRY